MTFFTEQIFDSFFILSFGYPVTLLISFWIVGKYIWFPMKEEYSKYKPEKIIIPYQNRYPFNPDKPVTDCSGGILDSAIAIEDTDQGLVVMRYKNDGFEYWADTTPQYRTLEAVARKFVTVFRCEHLYIHRLYELYKKYNKKRDEDELKRKEKKAVDSVPKVDGGVFALLNKIAPIKKKENIIACDKANTFIRRGRLVECEFFHPEEKEVGVRGLLNFSDWKKIAFP